MSATTTATRSMPLNTWNRVLVVLSLTALCLTGTWHRVIAQSATDLALIEIVEVAATLDLYNARCRGDHSGRYSDNLNKALVSTRRTTVLSVQDDLFPERSYRGVQARIAADFQAQLSELGGCRGAKADDFPQRLNTRYQTLLEVLDVSP